jgi:uncharacterized protein
LDQYISVSLVALMAGFGGSLHCVGMCGGLVTATCEKSHDVVRYQAGRLAGYLLLGIFAGLLGNFLSFKNYPESLSLITALMMGLIFIYMGFRKFLNKKSEVPLPSFMKTIYFNLWDHLVKTNKGISRAFFVGLISIMLPCGLIYGIALGTIALQDLSLSIVSVFFFWLGTLPSMVMAPGIVRKILSPLSTRLPKTSAVALMVLGLVTISVRVVKFENQLHSKGPSVSKPHKCH